jgi:hypothetical protein
MEDKNKLVEVCAECNRACCWYGNFMCDNAFGAGTSLKTVEELQKLGLEHPENWSDKMMKEVYGESAPHGYSYAI